MRNAVATAWRRIHERGPAGALRALRLTGAAIAAYLVALLVISDTRPLTAALTALLVVQVTLVGTIADTIRRIVSVIAGVGLAILLSIFVGFHWWSLALIILASLLVGQALRLGPHLLEVPISAMLILAVGGLGTRAVDRVVETLIGAAVGLLINVIFPPPVQTRSAGAAVERFAERIAALLDQVAAALASGEATKRQASEWLDDSRTIPAEAAQLSPVLLDAHESRRLNPRAVGTIDTTPDLRTGLDALEHAAVALRAVFRSVADRVTSADGDADADTSTGEFLEEDLRLAFATVLGDLARAFRAFGALVRAEVDDAEERPTAELTEALEAVGEARARLTDLLLVDPRESPALWQLHGSLLAGVERVLAELDVQERTRRRERRRQEAEAASRSPAVQAAERIRARARRVVRDQR
ncbi:MAG TPA: FUSC family protein [Jatrophihabitantaceae bacterium]